MYKFRGIDRKNCINSEELSQKEQFSWDQPQEDIYNANAVSVLQC